MTMKKLAAGLLACTAVVGLARADGVEGPYVGASIGRAHNGSDRPVAPTDRNDSSYKLYGGYGFTPNLALEAGYTDLGRFNTANGSLKAKGVFADVVGSWALAPQLSAIARLGLFNGSLQSLDDINGDSKDRGSSVKFGAGLQYELSKTVALRGEWERYRLNTAVGKPDVDTYNLGVHLRF